MIEGVDGLLRDKTRPPGTAPVAEERVKEVVRLTLAPPPHEATHWTGKAMAKLSGLDGSDDLEGARSQSPSLSAVQAVK